MIMKIGILGKLNTATKLYRIWGAVIEAANQDSSITFEEFDFEDHQTEDGSGFIFPAELDWDVAVVSMPSMPWMLRVFDILHQMGIAVVADFDDYVPGIVPGHRTYDTKSWRGPMIEECAKAVDYVTASTPFLKKAYGFDSKNSRVLRNRLPRNYVNLAQVPKVRRLCWPGSLDIHVDDFDSIGRDAMTEMCMKNAIPFHHIGTGDIAEKYGLNPKFTTEGGHLPMEQVYFEYARSYIGLVPLRVDLDFNKAKSYIKGLEFAGAGVPFVASPTHEYLHLADKGIGLIANNKTEWVEHVTRLCKDEGLWRHYAESGVALAKTLTYETAWHKWIESYERAINNFKKNYATVTSS